MVMKFGSAALLFLFIAGPTAAQEDIDCSDPLVQFEMNYCAHRDFEAADVELNAIWKDAKATAKALDDDFEEPMRGAEKALIAGQRGWIAYRDGHCEMVGWEAHLGSMEPMLVSGCKAELTRIRTKELKDFVGGLGQ